MTKAGLCGACEPEPRTGTSPCVLPSRHGGEFHQDKWTNRWPKSKGLPQAEATECQTPGYTDGPCHCAFHDPVGRCTEPTSAPPLPSAIRLDTQWCWDPMYPHLRRRVRIVGTSWDGETWWIKTEALSDSGGWQSGTQRLHTLDNFIESTVAVDHV